MYLRNIEYFIQIWTLNTLMTFYDSVINVWNALNWQISTSNLKNQWLALRWTSDIKNYGNFQQMIKGFLSNCFHIQSFHCQTKSEERRKNFIPQKGSNGEKEIVSLNGHSSLVVFGAYVRRLCVNCHLKIYNEESIEKRKPSFAEAALFSHITKHSIERDFNSAVANIYCDFIYIFPFSCRDAPTRCVITSLSLNRKTIECCKSLPQALCRRLFFAINADGWDEVKRESEKEIKDKVNRSVDVESSSVSGEKKSCVGRARNKKRIFEGLST